MDTNGACQCRKNVEDGYSAPLLAGNPLLKIHGRQVGEYDDKTIRDLKEGSAQAGEAESLDDERPEVADGTVDDLGGQSKENEEIGLRVLSRLDQLVQLDLGVLETGMVLTQSLNCELLLRVRQPCPIVRVSKE